jgi:hypothetical protein
MTHDLHVCEHTRTDTNAGQLPELDKIMQMIAFLAMEFFHRTIRASN